MQDIKKYNVLKDVIEKKNTGVQAALLLGFSTAHISRLKKRLLNHGFAGLLRKPRAKPPTNQLPKTVITKIIMPSFFQETPCLLICMSSDG